MLMRLVAIQQRGYADNADGADCADCADMQTLQVTPVVIYWAGIVAWACVANEAA